MRYVLHREDLRGKAEHGWLHSRHTFSFAQYYDPQRMGFGAFRVLNDDIVEASAGFGPHSHDNMEIISLALAGSMRHQDSIGNTYVIKQGEVQVMSAGTGVSHSEYNASDSEPLNFLQIWVQPKLMELEPRYSQKEFTTDGRYNKFQTIIIPDGSPASEIGALSINQDAWFSLADFTAGRSGYYELKTDGNGVYIFVLEGEIEVAGERLGRRDGMEIVETDAVEFEALAISQLLMIEVPL